jgi:hypothetical protein
MYRQLVFATAENGGLTMRLIDVPMGENDVSAETVGEFLKMLLLTLWEEGEGFSGKRPFGNSDWRYQVYVSLIKAGYVIGTLDEDGYIDDVDYAKADKLVMDAISDAFTIEAEPVKRGRWKGAGMGDYTCSLCMETVSGNSYNYCPNCGADMRGAEDE